MHILSALASVSVVVVLLAANAEGSQRELEAKQVQARKTLEAKRDAAIAQASAEFRDTHKGDEKWQTSLGKQKLTTYALQQALMRPDGQAIVASVSVVDVAKEGNVFRLRLLAPSLVGGSLYKQFLMFDLKCALADVNYDKLLSDPFTSNILPNYLVAALIHEVKSTQRILLSTETEMPFATEFTATGECLGLKEIGSLRRSYDQKLSQVDPRGKPFR